MSKQPFLLVVFLASAVGGIFALIKTNQPVLPEALAQRVESNLVQYIETIDETAVQVLDELRAGKDLMNTPFSFVVMRGDSIVEWGDNHFIPLPATLADNFQLKFQKTGTGEFLLRKWPIGKDRALVAVVPLHIQYKINNNYLAPEWNDAIFSSQNMVLLEPAEAQGYPVCFQQEVAFRVLPDNQSCKANGLWTAFTIGLFSISLVSLLALILLRVEPLSRSYPVWGFLLLLFLFFSVRIGMILTGFPAQLTESSFFDAKNFASSELNPSLGDLFLNSIAVLILCVYLFRMYYRFSFLKYTFSTRLSGLLFSIFCVVCILFGMLYPFVVMQTIYNNSTISLSISQSIYFNSLRVLALLSVVMAWMSSFFFMHVFLRLLGHERDIYRLMIAVSIGSIIFIEINILSGQSYFWPFLMGIAYLVCIISSSLYNSLQKFQYTTFTYFFVAVIFLALNGMIAVRHFEQQNNVQNQLRFGANFLEERDYFGEYLLYEATQRIAADAFIQNRLASPFLGKDVVIQKIKQVSLSGYFNRYNVEVSLFNASGEAIESVDTTTFSTLINRYDQEAFKTEYQGVFSITNPEGGFFRKYVVFAPILKNGASAGYVVIELLLKRVIPENVYPELLVDNRFQQGYRTQDISYAIVANQRVQYSAGDFNYDSFVANNLEDPRLFTQGIVKKRFVHIGLKDVNGKIVIISSPAAPAIYWFADFSFQVIVGMVIILLLLVFQGIYNYSRSRNLYLAARIQLILNLAFFLPLLAVSIITLSLTTQSSQEQLNSEFLSKANRFGGTVTLELSEHRDPAEFESRFTSLTTLANLDASVFLPDGRILATSQPLIFENYLLSPYMNPAAFKRIKRGEKIFVSTEQVGKLQFNVVYRALLAPDTGERIGILGIPFFQSAASLEKMQIVILANILSIFTLIFLVLLVISFLVTKWLTAPLRVIARTMGRVSLTGVNKPLQLQSNDEIGLMASEYNQMLIKLNASKQELERNQRERAWREIAQQVAHEIKNPLTPMKLTLQQLERTLQQTNQQDTKLNKVVDSLLSQVNSLDDIASSFSSFAKMPEPVMVPVDLINLLHKVVHLHAQEGNILFDPELTKAIVLADEQLLGRIFSNIMLNGLQAARPGLAPVIRIQIGTLPSKYLISFTDNGRGIDRELVDKIFLPHFTTKQSGSGLGLAISKQGIEQMGGRIWFETSDTGTTFTIELPHQG